MPEINPANSATQPSAKNPRGNASAGLTDKERAAIRERSRELKAAERRGPRPGEVDGGTEVLAKIAEMPERERRRRGKGQRPRGEGGGLRMTGFANVCRATPHVAVHDGGRIFEGTTADLKTEEVQRCSTQY